MEPPKSRQSSLSTRLLVWILPVSLTTTLAISLSTYLIARGVILWETQQGIAAVTQAAAAQVKAYFKQRDNDLATISQSPLFKDHYMNVEYGLDQEAEVYRREIERMLLDLERRSGAYPRLAYLDASGRKICIVKDGRIVVPDRPLEEKDYFVSLKKLKPGQRLVSPIIRVPWHNAPIVRYGTPIVDEAGRFRGALVFAVSLEPVYDSLGRLRLGVSGRSFLSARPLGRFYEGLSPSSRETLTSVVAIPGTPWSVVTVVDRRDFIANLAWVSTMTFFFALIASTLLVLIITRQVRTLLRPLQALVRASEAYAGGDLGVRVEVAGPGEVSALAESFNVMADRLKARTEDLMQRVRELTALHRMNDAVLRQLGRDAIGKASLEAAVQGLGFERGILYWVDEARGQVVGACVHGMEGVGLTDDEVRRRVISLESGHILAQITRAREPIYVEDAMNDPRCDREGVTRIGGKSFCGAPIVVRERVIAVICLSAPLAGKTIPTSQMRSLSLFCGAAGLALENAQLVDAIVASEARYRTAVENSPHAVVGLDQNFRITLWNRRAEALFGYQPTEAFGRTLSVIFGDKTYRLLKRQVETEGAIRQAEAAGSSRDGRKLDLNLSWTGQSAGPGGAREWFVVLQDETEKKRLQSQLIQAEKMTAVGSLIAGVAHELNNPLAAVTGFAELLKDLPAKPEEKEDLRLLYESALRCRDIVQGLLLFVRQDKAVRQRLSLNYVVQSTLALFEYRLIKTEGIKLEVELDPGVPQIAGEFQKLQQVLVNLLSNACDALKGRIGPRVIRARTRSNAEGSSVEIEDNGPGVPREKREVIFEPFHTSKPAGQGTGLGLSISKQIVSEFGGNLRYEDVAAGGARFVAGFPTCPADLPEPETVMQLPPSMPGRRVLVVDDEPELVQLMLRLLAEDGLIASASTDCRTIMRRIEDDEFDLVITDIDLGPSKGTQLLQASRGLTRPPSFIFVTGDVLNRSLAKELAELDVPVLPKPFLRTEFLRLVRRVLQQRPSSSRPRPA
ncbi:MAG: PAS domain S-box protein [Elusimicrobia bacterium]|nr:PAS domain S-box protein [Elusimicrobiota bacterium]